MEVKFTVNKGSYFWDFEGWRLDTGLLGKSEEQLPQK